MVQKRFLWAALAVTLSIVLAMIAVSATEDDISGTYKLVSDSREVLGTGEVSYPYGKHPSGYIMYGKDGRMLVLVTGDDRPRLEAIEKATPGQQAALFRSMLAYGGTYKFDGKKVEHHVDISWNGSWTGMTTVRNVRKEGGRLIYTTDAGPASGDGKRIVATLIWEKMQ